MIEKADSQRRLYWRGLSDIIDKAAVKAAEKEVSAMSRQKVMSEALKQEIAKRLGVDSIVSTQGWGGVSSKDCGNIVREAIRMAERSTT
jgi:small acid-soluble spore protein F (minor alpha/beta-type SASP)